MESAQFIWLALDITNLQKKPVDFIEEITSNEAAYKEDYVFAGWIRQYDAPSVFQRAGTRSLTTTKKQSLT